MGTVRQDEELYRKMQELVERSVSERRKMWRSTGEPEGEVKPLPKKIDNRLVPDPLMTDSEFLHQRQSNPTKPNIGRVWVQENAITRIGALCFIRRRLHHHEMAAERFKGIYESCYGSGTPAVDPSNEPVPSGDGLDYTAWRRQARYVIPQP